MGVQPGFLLGAKAHRLGSYRNGVFEPQLVMVLRVGDTSNIGLFRRKILFALD
jgi:hypothetical protein